MKLADGREVEVGQWIPGVKYNVYDCPGAGMTVVTDFGRGEAKLPTPDSGHPLLSMDIDEGVTPMFVHCPDDGQAAASRMYRVDARQTALYPVRMIWRKATHGELKRERREGGDHYQRGGLAREWVP